MIDELIQSNTLNNSKDTIRIAGIVRESIVDGPGIRFAVFAQGCPHNCKGCHNINTHDFAGGYNCEIIKILTAIDENPLLSGVTFTGGEPICQAEAFYMLASEVKKRNLNIVLYTGYTYEEVIEKCTDDFNLKKLIELVDIIIDGRYLENERDLTLLFRGSKNQQFIDMNLTRITGKKTISEKYL